MSSEVRSVVVERPGAPSALRTRTMPRPLLGSGAARIRAPAAGVTPVGASNRADPSGAGLRPPYVVGYEFAGDVLEVGSAVTSYGIGDEVWGMLAVRHTQLGSYADEVVVPTTAI